MSLYILKKAYKVYIYVFPANKGKMRKKVHQSLSVDTGKTLSFHCSLFLDVSLMSLSCLIAFMAVI